MATGVRLHRRGASADPAADDRRQGAGAVDGSRHRARRRSPSFPQRMSRFFHQAFAQVTNPPMDPIREHLVMSLRTYVGRRGSILEETPQQAHLMELSSAVLSDAEVEGNPIVARTHGSVRSWLDALFPVRRVPGRPLRAGRRAACRRSRACREPTVQRSC